MVKYNSIISNNLLQNPINMFIKKQHQFEVLLNKIELLNPLKVLDKGYSVVKLNDKVIKDASKLKEKDNISITLSKGVVKATVIGKE